MVAAAPSPKISYLTTLGLNGSGSLTRPEPGLVNTVWPKNPRKRSTTNTAMTTTSRITNSTQMRFAKRNIRRFAPVSQGSRGYNLAGITSHRETITSSNCVAGHLLVSGTGWVTCRLFPRRHFELVEAAFDERHGLIVPAGDAESLFMEHHSGQPAHNHGHHHGREQLEVDATGLHCQGDHTLFEVAETHCVCRD